MLILPILAELAGCADQLADQWQEPPALDAFEVEAAITDAQRYLGEGSVVLAVCGASTGASVYLDNLQDGLTKDGIDGGLVIFAQTQNGSPEILTRDVFREMIVASEDGGQISRLQGREDNGLGLWVIQYPSTGVVMSHNLATTENGTLIDLWTQNKPQVSILPARTSIFQTRCEIQS